jgi:hypothetical protein
VVRQVPPARRRGGWRQEWVARAAAVVPAALPVQIVPPIRRRRRHPRRRRRRGVPDRPERLEVPHRLSLRAPAVVDAAAAAFSRVSFRWSRGGRAGGEGVRLGFEKGEGRAAAGSGRGTGVPE